MTAGWRIATEDELSRIWPAIRTSVVAKSSDELRVFYQRAPWRVRISEKGDVIVLRRWRHDLNLLAIKAAVAPERRLPELVEEAASVARAQGFGGILSPLVTLRSLAPYLDAGMSQMQSLVALQSTPEALCRNDVPPVTLRRALPQDIDRLVQIDEQCFDPFWRYGHEELTDALARERVMVALDAEKIAGYATASLIASTCTLGRLAVDAESRRGGVGSALVLDVARWALEARAFSLTLCTQTSNETARSFYRRLGLAEMPEPYALAALEWQ